MKILRAKFFGLHFIALTGCKLQPVIKLAQSKPVVIYRFHVAANAPSNKSIKKNHFSISMTRDHWLNKVEIKS